MRAIQFAEPPSIRELVPDAPIELESSILHCLKKQPGERFNSAAALRESLRTILKTSQLDSLVVPSASLSVQTNIEFRTPEEEKRSTGLLSMLAERFRESGGNQSHNTIVVLPFRQHGSGGCRIALRLRACRRDQRAACTHAEPRRAAVEHADECRARPT